MNQKYIDYAKSLSSSMVYRVIQDVTYKIEEQTALNQLRKITNKDIKRQIIKNYEPELIYRHYNRYRKLYSRPFINIYCRNKLGVVL